MIAGDLNTFPMSEIEHQFNLTNTVTGPTRGCSTLDKILIDDSLVTQYGSCNIGPALGTSDHSTVFLQPLKGPLPQHT
jgi:hypothetical protein